MDRTFIEDIPLIGLGVSATLMQVFVYKMPSLFGRQQYFDISTNKRFNDFDIFNLSSDSDNEE
jgi:hypothetical protein